MQTAAQADVPKLGNVNRPTVETASAKAHRGPEVSKAPVPRTNFENLPDSAYIRQRELLGSVLPFSAATLWRLVKKGSFVAPSKLSEHITAWRVSEVRAWLEAQAKGA